MYAHQSQALQALTLEEVLDDVQRNNKLHSVRQSLKRVKL